MAAAREKPRRHRRAWWANLLIVLSVLLFLAAAATGGIAYVAWEWFHGSGPAARSGDQTVVMLEKGSGVSTISTRLMLAGVIDDDTLFKIGVKYYGNDSRLKYGEFAFPSGASMKEVMDILVEGKVIQYGVTVPEGRTSAMAMRILAADTVLTGESGATPAEGALLPETYLFTRGTTRKEIVARMTHDEDALAKALWEKRKADLPYQTLEEAVILASIVEKETGLASERPQVASVFVNRLRKGMKLQSDPTIIYGLTGGEPLGRGIRKSELEKATPYNTYIIDGLPPTPICNPGRASLEAVINPPDTDYLFFVADGTGGHAFAATLAEHEANVRKWREIEAQRGQKPGEAEGEHEDTP